MSTRTASVPNTRDAIIDAAQRFVQQASYDGFSFRDVAEVVGIRKASIYHHFETKEALAVAMLERGRRRLSDWFAAQSTRPPPERLAAYCFEFYGDALKAGERLCPGGAFAAGWSHMPESIRQATRALLQVHREFVALALADGAGDGSLRLPAGQSAESAADWLVANIQGALVVARAHGGREHFDALCRISLDQFRA